MLAKEHGQTVVSSVTLAQIVGESGCPFNLVISTGLDGTVMIWDLVLRSNYTNGINDAPNRLEKIEPWKSEASAQPLLRVL